MNHAIFIAGSRNWQIFCMKYYKNLSVVWKNTQYLQKYTDIIMHYCPIIINRCYILTKYGSDVNYLTKILWAK